MSEGSWREQSWSKRKAMKASPQAVPQVQGHQRSLELTTHHSWSWVLDTELQDLMFALLGFSLAFLPYASVSLSLLFGL